MSERFNVTIYTDGSCLGNPGPGGWACIFNCNGQIREISGGYKLTTNNRMELMGVINALQYLKEPCNVTIITDSRYVHDAIMKKWLDGWKKRNWSTADKKSVKNKDLWLKLDELLKKHTVRFDWVKAHNGQIENERCDYLAKEAAKKVNLPVDEGYK